MGSEVKTVYVNKLPGRRWFAVATAIFAVALLIATLIFVPKINAILQASRESACRGRIQSALDVAAADLIIDQADFVLSLSEGGANQQTKDAYRRDVDVLRQYRRQRDDSFALCKKDTGYQPTTTLAP